MKGLSQIIADNNSPETGNQWRADVLAAKLGEKLIGRRVITAAIGDWQGGRCEVFALSLDPGAPEIVFNVRRLSDGKEMGVFDYEPVDLVTETAP